jgi:hypothetical protein
MTDIEAKALALVNELLAERELPLKLQMCRLSQAQDEALCRAIEQHEAFRQEVSDVAVSALAMYRRVDAVGCKTAQDLRALVITKPDPLAEAMIEWFSMKGLSNGDHANNLRAALEARGWEIREKGNDR